MKHLHLLLLFVCALCCLSAQAGEGISYFPGYGSLSGRVEYPAYGDWTHYNRDGYRIGYSERNGGRTDFYNRDGYRVGYTEEDGNRLIYYNRDGYRIGHAEKR